MADNDSTPSEHAPNSPTAETPPPSVIEVPPEDEESSPPPNPVEIESTEPVATEKRGSSPEPKESPVVDPEKRDSVPPEPESVVTRLSQLETKKRESTLPEPETLPVDSADKEKRNSKPLEPEGVQSETEKPGSPPPEPEGLKSSPPEEKRKSSPHTEGLLLPDSRKRRSSPSDPERLEVPLLVDEKRCPSPSEALILTINLSEPEVSKQESLPPDQEKRRSSPSQVPTAPKSEPEGRKSNSSQPEKRKSSPEEITHEPGKHQTFFYVHPETPEKRRSSPFQPVQSESEGRKFNSSEAEKRKSSPDPEEEVPMPSEDIPYIPRLEDEMGEEEPPFPQQPLDELDFETGPSLAESTIPQDTRISEEEAAIQGPVDEELDTTATTTELRELIRKGSKTKTKLSNEYSSSDLSQVKMQDQESGESGRVKSYQCKESSSKIPESYLILDALTGRDSIPCNECDGIKHENSCDDDGGSEDIFNYTAGLVLSLIEKVALRIVQVAEDKFSSNNSPDDIVPENDSPSTSSPKRMSEPKTQKEKSVEKLEFSLGDDEEVNSIDLRATELAED